MDIAAGKGYPASKLSNFAPHEFEIDGVTCASMEGFLQSLKFKNPEKQLQVCTLVGKMAKSAGKNKNWHRDQTLYWRGIPIRRSSEEYQKLLDRAYAALAKNRKFRQALLATGNAALTHTLGKKKTRETVLTESEFVSRLIRLRDELRSQK